MTESTPLQRELGVATQIPTSHPLSARGQGGDDAPASRRLRMVTGYFQMLGTLATVRATVIGMMALSGADRGVSWLSMATIPWVLSVILTPVGLFWTARELRNRRRTAWLPALITLAVPMVQTLFGRGMTSATMLFSAAAVALLFSVRRELE